MTPEASLQALNLSPAISGRWSVQLSEPWRHYHTVEHIEHMLATLVSPAPAELIAAIWLHDIVYDPTQGDNEDRSAQQALGDLAGSAIDADAVARLVRGTKHHRPGDALQDRLNDLDLMILGETAMRYDRYAAAIRREYGHVPEELYRPGRAKVLRAFLERPVIYATAPFRHREGPARDNLAREIEALEARG